MITAYDYLIVGAGLFGSVFANEARKHGKRCLVIDRRSHVGGNIYTENIGNITVHKYGAHIFHTSDKEVWDYVNNVCKFNNFIHSPIAISGGKVYSLPFNMNTFSELWGITTQDEAISILQKQRQNIENPENLEQQALSLVGKDIYETLIKEYTQKQWGRPCSELPPFIIKRIPVRFEYNNNYFTDTYQGVPENGYTAMIENLLKNIDVSLNTKFSNELRKIAKKIIYTGGIDEFYGYMYGALEYRTLRFETEIIDKEFFQKSAVVNYCDMSVPYTRIIEHKYFSNQITEKTIISREFSSKFRKGDEPYYPINDDKNNALYSRYLEESKKNPNVIFGGRLGKYSYYDMDDVVRAALDLAASEF